MKLSILAVLVSSFGAACSFPPPPSDLTVTDTVPADQATEIDPAVDIRAMFSADVDATTLTADTFQVSLDGTPVEGAITYDPDTYVARWRPIDVLSLLGTYSVTLTAGIAGIDGTAIAADVSWTFTVRDGEWTEAEPVVGAPSAGYLDPDIAVHPAGDALIVWNPGDLWAGRRTADGWDEPVRIDDQDPTVHRPRIAIGADGTATAVWSQATGSNGLMSTWSNRSVPGVGWEDAVELEARSAGVIDPEIAAGPDGRAVAVWIQHRDDGMGQQVIANRFTNAWEGPQPIGETGVYGVSWASVTFDGRGDAIAIWSQSDDGTTSAAWVNRMTTGWTGPEKLETIAGSTSFPRVAGDDDGNVIAVWSVRDTSDVFHLRSSRFSPEADWSTAADLDAGFRPEIAFAPGGDAIVTYLKGEVPKMSVWSIRYRRSDGWSDPEPISAAGGVASHTLVSDPRGNALAIWTRSDGLGAPPSLWASRYTRAGGWGDPRRIDAGDGDPAMPSAGVDALGRITVIWQHGVLEARTIRFE